MGGGVSPKDRAWNAALRQPVPAHSAATYTYPGTSERLDTVQRSGFADDVEGVLMCAEERACGTAEGMPDVLSRTCIWNAEMAEAEGDALRRVPLIGGLLGGVGDVVVGVGNTALGIASFGQSGSFGRGMGQIGYGIGGTANILARDVAATIVGIGGTIYTTVRDVADVVSLGKVTSGGNPLTAVANLVSNALIPDYGMFGGRGWGSAQKRTQDMALNAVDYYSFLHDRDLGKVPRANTAWVRNHWSLAPNGQATAGPVGIAYVLAGTLPFLVADFFPKR